MKRKIAVVTGANSGMGLSTTIGLAKENIHVVMACRNQQRGEEALRLAKEKSGVSHIELLLCDLEDFDSISHFVEQFTNKWDVLDVLVNNAGVVSLKRKVTKEGYEAQLGVNHLGHFLLTLLLLDSLKAAQKARIVNVSSGAHKWGRIHFEDMNLEANYSVMKGYGQSKLANILFTKELAKRLSHTDITVNSLHPGAVSTNLGINRSTGFGKSVYKVLNPFFQSPDKGAETALYLAKSAEVDDVTGGYFYKQKPARVSKRAKDPYLAQLLWEWSEEELSKKGYKK
ncbi:SDR family oxidoreductase [Priestia filamentosa]|uniref:SDR family oxidoreductase n=1 Tax=Priestia filamentosa TaxID=1402861 RepID=UPI001FB3F87A|nr:SDR family oxidoreductase [Priestia filamentosa]MED3725441.1 SDR family oxidoreductase [Priestia filamentosa]UOE61315.1 SDR family oxidoreductase [Priestia filamentosa]